MNILVTGATGNVGKAVLEQLHKRPGHANITAAVRDIKRGKEKLGPHQNCILFDLEKGIYPDLGFDTIFLVRPPQIADQALFEKFLRQIDPQTRVVFLSVQGADTRAYLPHAKIEKVIKSLGLPHHFLRPSYFMENILTTLWEELSTNKRIFMPSGNLEFNWIAIEDIAEVGARALLGEVSQTEITLTNTERHGFEAVVELINRHCGTDLIYTSPSLIQFVTYSIRQGQPLSYTLVMLLLHYLPRFSRQQDPVSQDFEDITGRPPTTIDTFIKAHCQRFASIS